VAEAAGRSGRPAHAPYGRLRIVIEQRLWRPLSEVTIEPV
jgi:hypothetical protein